MARPLRLYWWRHRSGVLGNFGDELSPHLVSLVSGRQVEWAPVESCELAAVGSILEHVLRARADSPPAIWGPGFISAERVEPSEELITAAVRGRISAERVGGDPVLGDPALLARHLVTPARRRTGVGLVPHYRDYLQPIVRAFPREVPGGKVISPLQHPREVLSQIAACDVVLSSSLHGLIVADSLHVPNRWIELSDAVLGAGYKFRDYLTCFGESDGSPRRVSQIEDVDQAVGEALAGGIRLGLDDLVGDLVESFPSV